MNDQALIEEDLICKVCSKKFIEPYILPCGHSYCKECIKKLELVIDNEQRFYDCPSKCKSAKKPLSKNNFGVIRNYSVWAISNKINKVYILSILFQKLLMALALHH